MKGYYFLEVYSVCASEFVGLWIREDDISLIRRVGVEAIKG